MLKNPKKITPDTYGKGILAYEKFIDWMIGRMD